MEEKFEVGKIMFCFGHTKFEMHISYEVSMLRRQLAVQVWNSQKREPRVGDKNLGGPGEHLPGTRVFRVQFLV